MLTRLKVDGFKNLVAVDIRFGPFTCIAGANGVGKSNLFDAIHFLSTLANSSLLEAAQSVRDESGRNMDVRGLFHRVGNVAAEKMSFQAEMVVPPLAVDDLGHPFSKVVFACLENNWRNRGEPKCPEVGKGELLGYLNPAAMLKHDASRITRTRRVIDHPEFALFVPSTQQ